MNLTKIITEYFFLIKTHDFEVSYLFCHEYLKLASHTEWDLISSLIRQFLLFN